MTDEKTEALRKDVAKLGSDITRLRAGKEGILLGAKFKGVPETQINILMQYLK